MKQITRIGSVYKPGEPIFWKRKGGGFSPLDLFASGEEGAWYDPSDFSTMFQDSAGTTPVTAVGQSVGLILDKSKGLALGPEKWSDSLAVLGQGWSLSGDVFTTDGTSALVEVYDSLTIGKYYKFTATISGGSLNLYLGGGTVIVGTPGNFSWIGKASGTGDIVIQNNTAGAKTIANISVKELPGNHATQATADARPLYKTSGLAKYNDYDAVDDVLNSTFPSSLGSSCTVGRANVGSAATILTAQTIGTSYANSTDNAGLVIVNRALTTQETTDLTAWLTAKGATA